MTRLSPAVIRTVAVLNFFADHPRQSFTLTDIVRALKISRATCHSLLAALVDANYLYRDSEKSYIMGPGLARVGAVAHEHLSPLQVAIPEMRALADSLDVVCSAIALEKGEAVVRERAASFSHLGWTTQPDRRFPLKPPFGTVFMAWSSDQEVERWITGVTPETTAKQHQRILESIEFARNHGFAFGLRTENIRDEQHALALTYRLDKTEYMASKLARSEVYDLAFVAAPVFDARGRVEFALGLMGFVMPMSSQSVEAIGERLRQACDRISRSVGGRVWNPQIDPASSNV